MSGGVAGIAEVFGAKGSHLLIPHWEPVWSAEYVLDRIAELHRLGMDLNARATCLQDSVGGQARKYFGSWDAALERVGLDPAQIRRFAPYREWSPEMVLAGIRERYEAGQSLIAGAVKEGEDSDVMLLECAWRYFGSWTRALKAAGVDPVTARAPRRGKYPTGESVIRTIRKRKRAGLPLNSRAMTTGADRNGTLFNMARHHFGSWGNAVAAAGLDYDAARQKPRNPYQTKAAIVRAIRARERQGLPLTVSSLRQGPTGMFPCWRPGAGGSGGGAWRSGRRSGHSPWMLLGSAEDGGWAGQFSKRFGWINPVGRVSSQSRKGVMRQGSFILSLRDPTVSICGCITRPIGFHMQAHRKTIWSLQ